MAVDPTGLLSYTVGKTLDKVLGYVVEARKCFDHCEDLQTLLGQIKPLVAQAQAFSISRATGASPPAASGQAVETWLKDLDSQLDEAEKTLVDALASVQRRSLDLLKKKRYSDRIRKITERIRKTGEDGAPYAILAEVISLSSRSDYATQADVRDIRSDLASLSIQSGSQQQVEAAPRQYQHPLVQKLKELRKKTGRGESCRVKLEVADTHTSRFHVPGDSVGSASGDPEEADNHRGKVVKGGIEVNNATKLQLTMEADFGENWFFYIVFLDHSESARPSLYFPEEAVKDCNSLLGSRVFPDEDYDDDPKTMKLETSSNVPSDACEQVSLYLLVVDTFLGPEGSSITIEDVEKHLQSPDLRAIVKNWIFDIRPSKPQI